MSSAPRADEIAEQVMADPRLRAQVLQGKAGKAVAHMAPGRWMGLRVDHETASLREEILQQLPRRVRENAEASSSAHAEAVIQQFFTSAIRNPQATFMVLLALSVAVFLVGLGLIVVGVVLGTGADEGREAIVASVLGGGGVISTLGAIYTMASGGIRLANFNHAQARLVLTGFATELGHLRAYSLTELDEIERVNQRIREATNAAVEMLANQVRGLDLDTEKTESPIEDADLPPKVSPEGVRS